MPYDQQNQAVSQQVNIENAATVNIYQYPPPEAQATPPPAARRELPKLRPPGGAARLDDAYYLLRAADREAQKLAELEGETLILKAPRQMGKSSVLWRYLAAGEAAGKRLCIWIYRHSAPRNWRNIRYF